MIDHKERTSPESREASRGKIIRLRKGREKEACLTAQETEGMLV
jgi:hypothetical protein